MNYYYGNLNDNSIITLKSDRHLRKDQLNIKDLKFLVPISFLEYVRLYLKTNKHYKM